jgi:hypothetical protein
MKTNETPVKIYISTSSQDGTYYISNQYKRLIEYIRTDTFIKKMKEAFCKATCNGHPPRSTCTSLGTCKEYDNFVKLLKGK